jgi:peptidoglycan hydrolase-like protein with peptidoglycan-binding domain
MIKRILLVISISLLFVTASLAQGGTTAATPATTTAPATKPAAFRPTKEQVTKGQTLLKDAKLYTGDATGVYNDTTRAAIKSYQKANGLAENGKFDKATLEKMNIALTDKQKGIAAAPATPAAKTTAASTAAAADGPKRPAPFQANKDQITALQKVLIDGKMFAGEANGERSDALKASVTKYQTANGLKATGGINAATLEKMGIALTDAQKANVAAQTAYDAAKKN